MVVDDMHDADKLWPKRHEKVFTDVGFDYVHPAKNPVTVQMSKSSAFFNELPYRKQDVVLFHELTNPLSSTHGSVDLEHAVELSGA